MAIGFILISAAPAHEHEVYNKLSKVKEIVELHPLFGEYDIIAKVKVEDVSQLSDFIMEKVRSIDGVQRTSTLIVASPGD